MTDDFIFGTPVNDAETEASPVGEVSSEESDTTATVGGSVTSQDVAEKVTVVLDEETLTYRQGEPLYAPAKNVVDSREALDKWRMELNALTEKKATFARDAEIARREFELRMQEIREASSEIEDMIFMTRRNVREWERRTAEAEKILREELLKMMKKQEFLDNAVKFDEITVGLKWREWALPHQIEGAKFLATAERGILADKMGLGKTLTSLITADMLTAQKLLIIVPDDVVSNFAKEVAAWAPHRAAVVLGKIPKDGREAILTVLNGLSEFTVVVNYSVWRKDKGLLDKLAQLRFDMVVIDEAHTIKTTSTSAFVGVQSIVLAENSCPECRGKIQHVYDKDANQYDHLNKYIPRNYYVCVGNSNNWIPNTRDMDDVPMFEGCGWSQLMDIVADTTREYGYLRSVRHVIPMTGTPILNSPTDLFPLLNLLDDQQFNNKNEFIRIYCERDPYQANKIRFKAGGMDRLIKALSARYIARDRKSAGVVLPKQEVIIHNIEFDRTEYPDQYRVIKQLTKEAAIMLESTGQVIPILAIIALITRKRQANVWPAGIEFKNPLTGEVMFSVGDDVTESIKLDAIIKEPNRSESGEYEGLVPDFTGMGDMTNGERMVIFSQFKGPLRELERRINAAGISVVRLDGDTPNDIRNEIKDNFNRKLVEDPDSPVEAKWQVLLANYKTGGVGLNFTDATHAILLDEEWNPGKEEQAMNRIDRIGQTEENFVHILRLNNTIDTWMADLIEDKRDMIEGFEEKATAEMLLDFLKKESGF